MVEDYINNFSRYITNGLFYGFITTLGIITFVFLISLVILTIGCLIKSQTIKSKFLKISFSMLILLIFVLVIPIIFLAFKKLV